MKNEIADRKMDHLNLALSDNMQMNITSGFDEYKLEHCALPEMDFADIDSGYDCLGKRLRIPMIISSMTGGPDKCEKINKQLSEIAYDYNLGFAVGSQRIALEYPEYADSFKVRKYARNILLFANLGAVQLNYGYGVEHCQKAVDMIEADALILHLNAIQEVFQLSGNVNFQNLLKKIEIVCSKLQVPVIVKEIGNGISADIAKKLINAGVYAIDVAGAGSVSWSEIEGQRTQDIVTHTAASAFFNWGNSTAECIRSIHESDKNIKIIASGGVKNGVDMAKSIALGANVCANASTFLKKLMTSRVECENFVESLILEFKVAMFCTGCKTLKNLRHAKIKSI